MLPRQSRARFRRSFPYTIIPMARRRKRGRPRTGSRQVIPVRLAAKQIKKIEKLAELRRGRPLDGHAMVDRYRPRQPTGVILHARTGIKGRSAVERVIRVVAADQRVKATQAALMRAPSVKSEVNALRAEEERDEALAAYVHHHPLPRSR